MPEKSQVVFGFLFLGLVLIGVSTYFSFFAPKPSVQEIRLARIERESGKVSVLRSGYTQKENVDRKINVYNLDSVETMETGEALLSFESAYRVRLSNNTLVTLERIEDQESFRVLMIVKRGEVRVENFGREGELVIAKNGERVSATDYNSSPLAQMAVEPMKPVDDLPNPGPVHLGLTEDEIGTVMNNHRSSFFKCYTQLLQKEPSAKGNVALSFTIENNGKLSVAEVTASQMTNDEFKKCLLEVLRRIEFRSFKGPSISTLFPLKFE
ncbi:MAG: AgmX/PglI C-terminal domain-containing protein [Pseudobdellovibrionaceae bacterium]